MTDALLIQPPREPIGTTPDGQPVVMSRSWYRYFLDLYQRAGGPVAPSNSEIDQYLQYDIREADTAELTKRVNQIEADMTMQHDPAALVATLRSMIDELQQMVDALAPPPNAETMRRVDALETLGAFR